MSLGLLRSIENIAHRNGYHMDSCELDKINGRIFITLREKGKKNKKTVEL